MLVRENIISITSFHILRNHCCVDGSFYFSPLCREEMNFYHWQKMYQVPIFSQRILLLTSYYLGPLYQKIIDHPASTDSDVL